jgi:aerobic carbon-monoxide dehydrogenase small subunit
MKLPVSITVNGRVWTQDVEPRLLLVHFIREIAGLTGTKVGCDTSQCGACTVLLDGMAVKACTCLTVQADGASVTTIEGLASGSALHELQEAFWEKHGLQCGFCTPGMVLAAYDLLRANPSPGATEIRHALEGNLCRCTGYHNIVRAVQYAVSRGAPAARLAGAERGRGGLASDGDRGPRRACFARWGGGGGSGGAKPPGLAGGRS